MLYEQSKENSRTHWPKWIKRKKSQKYDANLPKNSSLYFQIDLIVCLLVAYGLLEMKFKRAKPQVVARMPHTEIFIAEVVPFISEVKKLEIPVEKQLPNDAQQFKEVSNNTLDVFNKATEKPTTAVS